MQADTQLITPTWPAPATVKSAISTRLGGYSLAPYDGNNLADHVDDNPDAVNKNRVQLKVELNLKNKPLWLQQVHGNVLVPAHEHDDSDQIEADGSYTDQEGHVCAVLTADCLPILLCNKQGSWVAAIHAGWKGIANRIVETAAQAYGSEPSELIAYLGPAIGPQHFEVQQDMVDAVTADLTAMQKKIFIKKCFTAKEGNDGYFLCDIYELARQRLAKAGITEVYGGDYCTFSDSERFYSHRRAQQEQDAENRNTGRMASLIWIDNS